MGGLRNYFNGATCEYCLFYTLTDENIEYNYPKSREYSKKVFDYISKPKKEVIKTIGQRVDHFFRFNSSQWGMPTKETYDDLVSVYKINEMDGFLSFEDFEKISQSEKYVFKYLNIPCTPAKITSPGGIIFARKSLVKFTSKQTQV